MHSKASMSPNQFFIYNTSGTTKTSQCSLSSDDRTHLESFLLALQYLQSKKVLVVSAIYTTESAYIYLHSHDEDWSHGIPCWAVDFSSPDNCSELDSFGLSHVSDNKHVANIVTVRSSSEYVGIIEYPIDEEESESFLLVPNNLKAPV